MGSFRFLLVSLSLSVSLFANPTQSEMENLFHHISIETPGTLSSLTPNQRQELFRRASENKVAGLEYVSKYDPSGLIGFCFGRAMAVHLIARKMGLKSESVRKLFIMGDLRSGEMPEWRFHVTTLVLGTDQKWYAVDPIMLPPLAHGTPLLMQDWMNTVQKTWDKNKKAHFYLVSNDAIMPDIREFPSPEMETGKRAIELKFDPTKAAGFTPVEGYSSTYALTWEVEQFHLLTGHAEKVADRFPFLAMKVNTEEYSFNGYFIDLLADLKRPGIQQLRPPRPRIDSPAFELMWLPRTPNLYSPKLLRGTKE